MNELAQPVEKVEESKIVELVKKPELAKKPELSINSLVDLAKSKNPDGGSVKLGDLEKKLKLSRHEVVELARHIKGAKLVVGRKGGESRLTWGGQIPNHMTHVVKHRTASPVRLTKHGIKYLFKINLNGKETSIPLTFDVQPA